jgi:hypothetical protein
MQHFTFRPIERWLGPSTPSRRYSPFRASYSQTLALLDRELRALRASRVVIQLALEESDIRLDGLPRASARPKHPGVILAFHSDKHGMDLQYALDAYTKWEDNLRAIALGLEALRKVDRYGVTKHGEQYRGWRQLGPGNDGASLVERGHVLIEKHGSITEALRATHPDHGGDPEDFIAVQAARG